jgi:hypothetical protein
MQENKNVNEIVKQLVKTKYKRTGILCVGFFFLVGLVGTIYVSQMSHVFNPAPLFFGLVPSLLFFLFVYIKAQEAFFKEYAQKLGFIYKGKGNAQHFSGSLFSIGHSRRVTHLIVGDILKHNTQIFSYQYVTGSGKHRQTHSFQIFEITFDKSLPFFTLKEKMLFFSPINISTTHSTNIKLEGNFNTFFDLEVEKEFEIELLQIFTPDLMHELCEKWKHLSIESIENKVYIYENRAVNATKELDSMFDLAGRFIKSIENLGPSFFKDVKALRDIINKNTNQ